MHIVSPYHHYHPYATCRMLYMCTWYPHTDHLPRHNWHVQHLHTEDEQLVRCHPIQQVSGCNSQRKHPIFSVATINLQRFHVTVDINFDDPINDIQRQSYQTSDNYMTSVMIESTTVPDPLNAINKCVWLTHSYRMLLPLLSIVTQLNRLIHHLWYHHTTHRPNQQNEASILPITCHMAITMCQLQFPCIVHHTSYDHD